MSQLCILDELKTQCSFPEVFGEKDKFGSYPRKIGHIRADYDGYRWHNTIWSCHNELCTPDIAVEIDKVYERLVAKNAFSDFEAMLTYCRNHPEAKVSEHSRDEYNFYYEGTLCLFWIRCIPHRGDYHIYLHAFNKEKDYV